VKAGYALPSAKRLSFCLVPYGYRNVGRPATEEGIPRADKSSCTDKQKRVASDIEKGYEGRGADEKEAARRAWATVNKQTRGGKKSGSGRDLLQKDRRPPRKPPQCANAARREISPGNFRCVDRVLNASGRSDPSAFTECIMLGWALTFLIVAIIAGVLGFGGVAFASAEIAKIIFVIFLVLFAVSLIAGMMRGRGPTI
jgi:uncharacterized membrane protein YtjA (UPF0391 family)